jgi:hypothetical protein
MMRQRSAFRYEMSQSLFPFCTNLQWSHLDIMLLMFT